MQPRPMDTLPACSVCGREMDQMHPTAAGDRFHCLNNECPEFSIVKAVSRLQAGG